MQKDKKKFTLEEMLSIKKAERPSSAQWENFNAQLKSKMLKSMVAEKPKRFAFSPWTLAKIGAVAMPVFGIMLTFFARPANIDTLSLQNAVEFVSIPDMETSYYADTYFSQTENTQYLQDMIQCFSDSNIVYATNDLLSLKNLSF